MQLKSLNRGVVVVIKIYQKMIGKSLFTSSNNNKNNNKMLKYKSLFHFDVSCDILFCHRAIEGEKHPAPGCFILIAFYKIVRSSIQIYIYIRKAYNDYFNGSCLIFSPGLNEFYTTIHF